ncbi:hypothetical protein PTTG_26720 [Puccinia triticina 1-1 BBBD Race 1]|uniref:Uncharacterized protein n=2 Tax=Puccinia triticina TaxID=208348 RepID=A0A180GS10_PUCT1|nr:uncharacterized protein PtA15_3A523 [Puccinia triticina]OAV95331.1 hypothetical protein PTTG_26720 [Puccinia triticina 1-1 BBBD Race 1]WAQ83156.1 hypothetical protein PtA15_3A523 [Puccinia triticina]WAR53999.1 hypothetical protein PtB15_3B509 [Puccinia triticina]
MALNYFGRGILLLCLLVVIILVSGCKPMYFRHSEPAAEWFPSDPAVLDHDRIFPSGGPSVARAAGQADHHYQPFSANNIHPIGLPAGPSASHDFPLPYNHPAHSQAHGLDMSFVFDELSRPEFGGTMNIARLLELLRDGTQGSEYISADPLHPVGLPTGAPASYIYQTADEEHPTDFPAQGLAMPYDPHGFGPPGFDQHGPAMPYGPHGFGPPGFDQHGPAMPFVSHQLFQPEFGGTQDLDYLAQFLADGIPGPSRLVTPRTLQAPSHSYTIADTDLSRLPVASDYISANRLHPVGLPAVPAASHNHLLPDYHHVQTADEERPGPHPQAHGLDLSFASEKAFRPEFGGKEDIDYLDQFLSDGIPGPDSLVAPRTSESHVPSHVPVASDHISANHLLPVGLPAVPSASHNHLTDYHHVQTANKKLLPHSQVHRLDMPFGSGKVLRPEFGGKEDIDYLQQFLRDGTADPDGLAAARASHTPAHSPQTPSHSPQTPFYSPQAPSHSPQAPSHSPQTPFYSPQAPSRSPQAPSHSPQAPSHSPQAPSHSPQAPPHSPTISGTRPSHEPAVSDYTSSPSPGASSGPPSLYTPSRSPTISATSSSYEPTVSDYTSSPSPGTTSRHKRKPSYKSMHTGRIVKPRNRRPVPHRKLNDVLTSSLTPLTAQADSVVRESEDQRLVLPPMSLREEMMSPRQGITSLRLGRLEFDWRLFAPNTPSDPIQFRENESLQGGARRLPNGKLVILESKFLEYYPDCLRRSKHRPSDGRVYDGNERQRRLALKLPEFEGHEKHWYQRWFHVTGKDFSQNPHLDDFDWARRIFPIYLFYVEMISSIVPREKEEPNMSLATELEQAQTSFNTLTEDYKRGNKPSMDKQIRLIKKQIKRKKVIRLHPLLWRYVRVWMLTCRRGVFQKADEIDKDIHSKIKEFFNNVFYFGYSSLHQSYFSTE